MIIGLLIVLGLILVLPFTFRAVEHNLEYFLFIMGVAAAIISGIFSLDLFVHILENPLIYFITTAVLVAGILFRYSVSSIKKIVHYSIIRIPLKLFLFVLIVGLGMVSSVITAIIAALILVEIVHALPFKHRTKVLLTIISCFSIGFGAALTPIGEPLSTIVISALDADFFYLVNTIGIYIIPAIIALGLFGAFYVEREYLKDKSLPNSLSDKNEFEEEESNIAEVEMERLSVIIIRAIKIFIFVVALELLGAGFKPIIDNYVIHMDSKLLYWLNMSSAVLDNATIAAAEISPAMTTTQLQAILIGLLISGGMLIPGNIPNIISASKLNIKSKEWAVTGLPIGLFLMLVYFVIIFFV